MLKSILLASVAACATGAPIEAVSSPADHADAGFPTRRSLPELPRARDALVRASPDRALSAGVELCVMATGDTASVRLRRSSGDRGFDEAVLSDAARWRYDAFSPQTGADGLACEQATITYMP